ncbi:MAG: chromate efflux transporter [Chloroflexi bacterium]|nr:chromate efflux transporter [Chloroflexota bacterium]
MGDTPGTAPSAAERGPLGEVARLFLLLGTTAFGGPAAHIAMMREQVVTRRRWITDATFLDLLGATNLIPGPNSTELAIHLGFRRAGWRGLLVAGLSFIIPAALMVLALAWAYVEYGARPWAQDLLYGVKPVVIAVVINAIVGLGRTAVSGPLLAAAGAAVFALFLAGGDELLLLFGGALIVALIRGGLALGRGGTAGVLGLTTLVAPAAAPAAGGVSGYSAITLFLVMLKVGALLYGSGYVLLAFLRGDLVDGLGWLTDQELLDAIAVGQVTPGPVFTTATFVGYLVGGVGGAIVATVAIFVPSFLFVGLIGPLLPRLRQHVWTAALLDGVNVAALGLMAAVTVVLARDAVVDVVSGALALLAAIALVRFRVNSAWLVLGGGAIGILYRGLGG